MRGLLFLLTIGVVFVGWSLAPAQEAGGPGDAHFGAGSCAAQACHGGLAGAPEIWRRSQKTWAVKDKHAGAYELLDSPLGKRIAARLDIEDPKRAQECISCHGTPLDARKAKTFDNFDAVSCELCHGAAERWLGPHAAPGWREVDEATGRLKDPAAHREKQLRHGMRPLETARERATACVGCHVAGEGQDITHDIMAAGHPPLVFDAAVFQDWMTPHWDRRRDPPRVATWIDGLRANAAAQLGHAARAARATKGIPDFTAFDCNSCHHAIYEDSAYVMRDPPGRPGDLPVELSSLKVLAVALGRVDEFARVFRLAYAPGGDPKAFAKAAAGALQQVQEMPMSGAAKADELLGNLATYLRRRSWMPQTEMQQITLAIASLAPDRAQGDAYEKLKNAVQLRPETKEDRLFRPGTYDAKAALALALEVLGG